MKTWLVLLFAFVVLGATMVDAQGDLSTLKLASHVVSFEFRADTLQEMAMLLAKAVNIDIQVSDDAIQANPSFNMRGRFSSARFEDVLKFVLDRANADYTVIDASTLRIVKKQIQPAP